MSPTVLSSPIADFASSTSEQKPKLQQDEPLDIHRDVIPDELQHKTQEKNHIVNCELTPSSQFKQDQRNVPCTNSNEFFKELALLTPDEYEDSELDGEFQHIVHILIPSNATTALLDRRGQPIQRISQQTGCTLSVRKPEASLFKDDRLLRMYGKARCICLAQRLVIAYIRAFRAEKKDPIYMDLSEVTPPVKLSAASITKAISVAVTAVKKNEVETTNSFHWMVRRDDVGKIMGKQGCILASIRRDTGATIRIDNDVVPGTTERRVTFSGSVESIVAAVEKIKSRSRGHPEVAASVVNDKHGQYFAIPYHAAGYLIGVQGSTIKNITERTGARLQFPSAEDLPLGSINRIFHVQGTLKQAEHARRIVSAKLRDFLASSKSPKSLSLFSTGLKGDKVTIKVLLPSKVCGSLLDRRGQLIREISKKSGAHTHFLAAHDDGNRETPFLQSGQLHPESEIVDNEMKSKTTKCVIKWGGMEDEEHKDDVEEGNYVNGECEDALGHPVRRRNARRQPNCPLRLDDKEDEANLYIYDD
ncbi:unnamed protein product [Peronospora belbahrii]|uniref:K Homology domain-containing protein n=1 Tax=Peronospora belbahrii TaxID=622444 RepID=A0AAU9KMG0_9STRA|nr:unnamed protein product [Peronospora belbahrii]